MTKIKYCIVVIVLLFSVSHARPYPYRSTHYLSHFHYLMARLYQQQGDLYQAKKEYEIAVRLDPLSPLLYEELIDLCYVLGDYGEAILCGKKLIELDPQNIRGHIVLGNIAFSRNLFKEAIMHYEEAVNLDVKNVDIYLVLGRTYQEMGDWKNAEKVFLKALDLSPEDLDVLLSLGYLYESIKEWDKALHVYHKIEEIDPYDVQNIVRIGTLYDELKKIDLAKKYLQKALALNPNDLKALYSMAKIGEREGNWKVVSANMNRVKVLLNEETPMETYLYLSFAYLQQNIFEKATQTIEEALIFYPNNSSAWYFLGAIREAQQDFSGAITAYQRAISYDETNVVARFHLGVCYDQTKRYSLSEEMFRKVIELDPGYAAAYNYLGYSMADRGINLKDSYEFIRKALELDPHNGAYVDSLGWVLYKQGKYEEALKELKRASRILSDPMIFEHLGDAYHKLEQPKKAERAYRRALKLDSNSKDLQRKLKDLEGN